MRARNLLDDFARAVGPAIHHKDLDITRRDGHHPVQQTLD
jgi:hypothetical protein